MNILLMRCTMCTFGLSHINPRERPRKEKNTIIQYIPQPVHGVYFVVLCAIINNVFDLTGCGNEHIS